MTCSKEALLEFALTASDQEVEQIADACLLRLAELDAVGVGFTPLPECIQPAGNLTAACILSWISTVRQPVMEEFRNRPVRNRLVYEVEKLGEFHQTLMTIMLEGIPEDDD